jgi:hypothetical protein
MTHDTRLKAPNPIGRPGGLDRVAAQECLLQADLHTDGSPLRPERAEWSNSWVIQRIGKHPEPTRDVAT